MFPQSGFYQPPEAYFHTNGKFIPGTDEVTLNKDQYLCTDTYFNVFDLEVWKQHTQLTTVSLCCKCAGRLRFRIYISDNPNDPKKTLLTEFNTAEPPKQGMFFEYDTVSKDIAVVKEYDIFTSTEFTGLSGMLTLEVVSYEKKARFCGGYFFTEEPPALPNAKIGWATCTFKRENFILKNIAQLRKDFLDNPEWQDRFSLFLVDNGSTLQPINHPRITLVQNQNSGGAGGFTRAMMLAEKSDCTHMLLMDDDIVFHSGIMRKAWYLLRYSKSKVCYSAAMINLDENMNIQHERGGFLVADGARTLLNRAMGFRQNIGSFAATFPEKLVCFQYGAWWWFLCPLSVLRKDKIGYAFPFFIKGDDIDFSYRVAAQGYAIAYPAGFGIWHEPFDNKLAPVNEFFAARNQMIQTSLHNISYASPRDWLSIICHFIFTYHYENAEMMMQGLADFLKGPSCILENKPDYMIAAAKAATRTMKKQNWQLAVISEHRGENKSEGKYHRLFRILTLNGLLWRVKNDHKAIFLEYDPFPWVRDVFGFREVQIVRPTAKTIYSVSLDRRHAWKLLFRAVKLYFALKSGTCRAKKMWQDAYPDMISADFWNKYLQLAKTTDKK